MYNGIWELVKGLIFVFACLNSLHKAKKKNLLEKTKPNDLTFPLIQFLQHIFYIIDSNPKLQKTDLKVLYTLSD